MFSLKADKQDILNFINDFFSQFIKDLATRHFIKKLSIVAAFKGFCEEEVIVLNFG